MEDPNASRFWAHVLKSSDNLIQSSTEKRYYSACAPAPILPRTQSSSSSSPNITSKIVVTPPLSNPNSSPSFQNSPALSGSSSPLLNASPGWPSSASRLLTPSTQTLLNIPSVSALSHPSLQALTSFPDELWRSKDKRKAAALAMVMCLRIGVDPPDVPRTPNCARIHGWIDPEGTDDPAVAGQRIAAAVQANFNRLRATPFPTKVVLDPTKAAVLKACKALRKAFPTDRVIFYYNGHGVPKPTHNGEIWVYDQEYTQYVPLSLKDVQYALTPFAPVLLILDGPAAGLAVDKWELVMAHRVQLWEREQQQAKLSGNMFSLQPVGAQPTTPPAAPTLTAEAVLDPYSSLLLAACGADEILPLLPEYPVDILTSALVTPVKLAVLHHFNVRYAQRRLGDTIHTPAAASVDADAHAPYRAHASPSALLLADIAPPPLSVSDLQRIPGIDKPAARGEPFGDLAWALVTVTDAIAWSSLPPTRFQLLFRRDPVVASLFRNFLLAQRVLRALGLTPVSRPALPDCSAHPLWSAWDTLVGELFLKLSLFLTRAVPITPSAFFERQLAALETVLELSATAKRPPLQLPVLLQVLLVPHALRLQALRLLVRFIDRSPAAVVTALSTGLLPYLKRLLEGADDATAPSVLALRNALTLVWSKVLPVDPDYCSELAARKPVLFFLQQLALYRPPPPTLPLALPVGFELELPADPVPTLARSASDVSTDSGGLGAADPSTQSVLLGPDDGPLAARLRPLRVHARPHFTRAQPAPIATKLSQATPRPRLTAADVLAGQVLALERMGQSGILSYVSSRLGGSEEEEEEEEEAPTPSPFAQAAMDDSATAASASLFSAQHNAFRQAMLRAECGDDELDADRGSTHMPLADRAVAACDAPLTQQLASLAALLQIVGSSRKGQMVALACDLPGTAACGQLPLAAWPRAETDPREPLTVRVTVCHSVPASAPTEPPVSLEPVEEEGAVSLASLSSLMHLPPAALHAHAQAQAVADAVPRSDLTMVSTVLTMPRSDLALFHALQNHMLLPAAPLPLTLLPQPLPNTFLVSLRLLSGLPEHADAAPAAPTPFFNSVAARPASPHAADSQGFSPPHGVPFALDGSPGFLAMFADPHKGPAASPEVDASGRSHLSLVVDAPPAAPAAVPLLPPAAHMLFTRRAPPLLHLIAAYATAAHPQLREWACLLLGSLVSANAAAQDYVLLANAHLPLLALICPSFRIDRVDGGALPLLLPQMLTAQLLLAQGARATADTPTCAASRPAADSSHLTVPSHTAAPPHAPSPTGGLPPLPPARATQTSTATATTTSASNTTNSTSSAAAASVPAPPASSASLPVSVRAYRCAGTRDVEPSVRAAAVFALGRLFSADAGDAADTAEQTQGSGRRASPSPAPSPALEPKEGREGREKKGKDKEKPITALEPPAPAPISPYERELELLTIGYYLAYSAFDAAPLVRQEACLALAELVYLFQGLFVRLLAKGALTDAQRATAEEDARKQADVHAQGQSLPSARVLPSASLPVESMVPSAHTRAEDAVARLHICPSPLPPQPPRSRQDLALVAWQALAALAHDPMPQVAASAESVLEYVRHRVVVLREVQQAVAGAATIHARNPRQFDRLKMGGLRQMATAAGMDKLSAKRTDRPIEAAAPTTTAAQTDTSAGALFPPALATPAAPAKRGDKAWTLGESGLVALAGDIWLKPVLGAAPRVSHRLCVEREARTLPAPVCAVVLAGDSPGTGPRRAVSLSMHARYLNTRNVALQHRLTSVRRTHMFAFAHAHRGGSLDRGMAPTAHTPAHESSLLSSSLSSARTGRGGSPSPCTHAAHTHGPQCSLATPHHCSGAFLPFTLSPDALEALDTSDPTLINRVFLHHFGKNVGAVLASHSHTCSARSRLWLTVLHNAVIRHFATQPTRALAAAIRAPHAHGSEIFIHGMSTAYPAVVPLVQACCAVLYALRQADGDPQRALQALQTQQATSPRRDRNHMDVGVLVNAAVAVYRGADARRDVGGAAVTTKHHVCRFRSSLPECVSDSTIAMAVVQPDTLLAATHTHVDALQAPEDAAAQGTRATLCVSCDSALSEGATVCVQCTSTSTMLTTSGTLRLFASAEEDAPARYSRPAYLDEEADAEAEVAALATDTIEDALCSGQSAACSRCRAGEELIELLSMLSPCGCLCLCDCDCNGCGDAADSTSSVAADADADAWTRRVLGHSTFSSHSPPALTPAASNRTTVSHVSSTSSLPTLAAGGATLSAVSSGGSTGNSFSLTPQAPPALPAALLADLTLTILNRDRFHFPCCIAVVHRAHASDARSLFLAHPLAEAYYTHRSKAGPRDRKLLPMLAAQPHLYATLPRALAAALEHAHTHARAYAHASGSLADHPNPLLLLPVQWSLRACTYALTRMPRLCSDETSLTAALQAQWVRDRAHLLMRQQAALVLSLYGNGAPAPAQAVADPALGVVLAEYTAAVTSALRLRDLSLLQRLLFHRLVLFKNGARKRTTRLPLSMDAGTLGQAGAHLEPALLRALYGSSLPHHAQLQLLRDSAVDGQARVTTALAHAAEDRSLFSVSSRTQPLLTGVAGAARESAALAHAGADNKPTFLEVAQLPLPNHLVEGAQAAAAVDGGPTRRSMQTRPMPLVLHPFEPLLIVGTASGHVLSCDYSATTTATHNNQPLAKLHWSDFKAVPSRACGPLVYLALANEFCDSSALLCVSDYDRVVRVYQNIHKGQPELLTAFVAHSSLMPTKPPTPSHAHGATASAGAGAAPEVSQPALRASPMLVDSALAMLRRRALLSADVDILQPGMQWGHLPAVLAQSSLLSGVMDAQPSSNIVLDAMTGVGARSSLSSAVDRSLGWSVLGAWRCNELTERIYLDTHMATLPESFHHNAFNPPLLPVPGSGQLAPARTPLSMSSPALASPRSFKQPDSTPLFLPRGPRPSLTPALTPFALAPSAASSPLAAAPLHNPANPAAISNLASLQPDAPATSVGIPLAPTSPLKLNVPARAGHADMQALARQFNLATSAELSGVPSIATLVSPASLPHHALLTPMHTAAAAATAASPLPPTPAAPRTRIPALELPASSAQCHWHPATGRLFVSVDYTKVWDVERQLPVADLPIFPLAHTHLTSMHRPRGLTLRMASALDNAVVARTVVSSILSRVAAQASAHAHTPPPKLFTYATLAQDVEPVHATAIAVDPRGDVVFTGLNNGYVSVVDARIPPVHSLVSCFSTHVDPVAHVAVLPREEDEFDLVSISRAGIVNVVDGAAPARGPLPHDLCAAPVPPSPMFPDDSFTLDGPEEEDESDDEWFYDYILDADDAPEPARASARTVPLSRPTTATTEHPPPIMSYYRKAHTSLPPARVHTPQLHSPLEPLPVRGGTPGTGAFGSAGSVGTNGGSGATVPPGVPLTGFSPPLVSGATHVPPGTAGAHACAQDTPAPITPMMGSMRSSGSPADGMEEVEMPAHGGTSAPTPAHAHSQTISNSTSVSTAAVHPLTKWVATGSLGSFVDLFQMHGDSIQTIKHHPSFVSQRIAPVRSLQFHSLKPLLAMASDRYVTLYVANRYPWSMPQQQQQQ